jgi:hypothetical protein
MTLIQALAVMMPTLWLIRRSLGLPPAAAALATLAAVLCLIGALWWMRWRGMQRTWARARLVAEVARSQMTAAIFPLLPARRVLGAIPDLKPIIETHDEAHEQPWPQWRETWIKNRVDDQLAYYRMAKQRAEESRKHFTKWATVLMDVMLALGAAGVILTLSSRAPQWLRMLGDYRIEAFLGVAGVVLPLGIVLLQSLRYLQELNRRTARFARQISMLEKARSELLAKVTPEEALPIVSATEDQLLGEVVDWYFEAETAEQFYQVRENKAKAIHKHRAAGGGPNVAKEALALGGAGLIFLRLSMALVAMAFLGTSLAGRSKSTTGTLTLTRWAAICAPITPAPRTWPKLVVPKTAPRPKPPKKLAAGIGAPTLGF